MEPLVEPAHDGSYGANDEHALNEQAKAFTTTSPLLRNGDAAGTTRRRGEVHWRDHVHVRKPLLALKTRCVGNKTLQAMDLPVELVRTFGQMTRFAP